VVAAGLVLVVAAACSPEEKHEVLVFLFDGVPPLGGGPAGVGPEGPEGPEQLGQPRRVKGMKKFYNHPAYWESRCGGCHDINAGTLLKTVRQGLCRTCHPEKPPKKKFVHGPVAVNACLACHRYHKSFFPKVLVTDAQDLCFQCHLLGELRIDAHHETMETERCIDCHDPHGGDDRFFIIPEEERAAKEEAAKSS
jgi:predicted CXXCH cytochrome family protein